MKIRRAYYICGTYHSVAVPDIAEPGLSEDLLVAMCRKHISEYMITDIPQM